MPEQKVVYKSLRMNILFLKTAGVLYTGTWPSFFYCSVVTMQLGLGAIHHGVKLKDYQDLGLHQTMEQAHYAVMLFTFASISLLFITHSSLFLSLARAVDSGLEEFGARPQPTSVPFVSEANRNVRTFNRMLLTVVVTSILGLHIKTIIEKNEERKKSKNQWELFVSGWTPFVVDSWPEYIATNAFQFMLSILLPYCSAAVITAYVALSCHLCAQFRILRSMVLRPNPGLEEMVSVIKYHNAIIRFYSTFQELYSLILLCLSGSTVLLLCTVGYIITDPKSTTILIITFLGFTLLIGSLTICLCWFGEQILLNAEKLRQAVYYTDWYDHPQAVKKMWLMMLLRCGRDFPMTGAGLQKFNLQGFSEILSAAYSFFNMLIALRGKKIV